MRNKTCRPPWRLRCGRVSPRRPTKGTHRMGGCSFYAPISCLPILSVPANGVLLQAPGPWPRLRPYDRPQLRDQLIPSVVRVRDITRSAANLFRLIEIR